MPIKFKLSKAEYDALPEDRKDDYIANGDEYIVDLTDAPKTYTQADIDALTQAKGNEKKLRQDLQKELNDLKKAGEGNSSEAEQLREEMKALSDRLSARDNALKASATKLAAESVTKLAKTPSILLPHVMARLQADIDEQGNAKVTILGADGKPSQLTLEQLGKEFQTNADFADVMLAPGSSGSGGAKGNSGGNAGTKSLKDMSEQERVALAKSDPEAFKALTAQANPSA